MKTATLSLLLLPVAVTSACAQLSVTVWPPRLTGNVAAVKLQMRNHFTDKIESARAVCFLLDGDGKMVGVATRWVIGGSKSRPPLAPKMEATFNFVITNTRLSAAGTNLTAKVTVTRLILQGGKPADVRRDVRVVATPTHHQ